MCTATLFSRTTCSSSSLCVSTFLRSSPASHQRSIRASRSRLWPKSNRGLHLHTAPPPPARAYLSLNCVLGSSTSSSTGCRTTFATLRSMAFSEQRWPSSLIRKCRSNVVSLLLARYCGSEFALPNRFDPGWAEDLKKSLNSKFDTVFKGDLPPSKRTLSPFYSIAIIHFVWVAS